MIDKRGTNASAQLTKWKDYMVEMGYGYRLGIDLPHVESRGFIPNADFYSKSFRGANWRANSIISISIGQGEVLATPLQIANLCATIANRGYFYTPHIVKEISDTVIDSSFRKRHKPDIRRQHYELVAEACGWPSNPRLSKQPTSQSFCPVTALCVPLSITAAGGSVSWRHFAWKPSTVSPARYAVAAPALAIREGHSCNAINM